MSQPTFKFKSSNPEDEMIKFKGNNFDEWKEEIQLHLMRKNLWNLVTRMEEEPADAKEKLKFMACSQEAYALISLSICSSHRDCLRRMGDNYDPADAWNAVLQHFGPTSAISQTLLLFQLLSLSQGSNDL